MFKDFWEQNKPTVQFAGFISALGGLFLNIPVPAQEQGKHFLANVQVFWLVLFFIGLVYLSASFVKFIFHTEKRLQGKYDLPTMGVFSFTVAAVLLWVTASLFGYISTLYSSSFVELLNMTFPAIVLILCFQLLIFMEKRKNILPIFKIMGNSLVLAILITITGIYLQQAVLKYFYFYWVFLIFPLSFFILFLFFMVLEKFRKK